MKNAYVVHHHLGDDGNVTEGMILRDISQKRFDALRKRGLVREATADEVKAGHKPPFVASGQLDASEPKDGETKAAPAPDNKKAADPANKGD